MPFVRSVLERCSQELDVAVQVFIVIASGTFTGLVLVATFRWWQWARIQPSSEEQDPTASIGSAPTHETGDAYARVPLAEEQPPEEMSPTVCPARNTFTCHNLAALKSFLKLCFFCGFVAVSAAFATAAALIWLADAAATDGEPHPDSAAAFVVCASMSVLAAVVGKTLLPKDMLTEWLPGGACFEGDLPLSYRKRATATYHSECYRASQLASLKSWLQAEVADFRSLDGVIAIRVLVDRILFMLDVGTDINLAIHVYAAGVWQWGALILVITLFPYIGMSIFFGPTRIASLAVSLWPSLEGTLPPTSPRWCCMLPVIDVAILCSNLCSVPAESMTNHYLTARLLAEAFLEAVWQAILQTYILIRISNPFGLQHLFQNAARMPVDFETVLQSVFFSLLACYNGFDKLTKYAAWQTKRNKLEYIKKMQNFGDGLAPSGLLQEIQQQSKIVVSPAQLHGVSVGGFDSIIKSIIASTTMRAVTFPGEFLTDYFEESDGPGETYALVLALGNLVMLRDDMVSINIEGEVSPELGERLANIYEKFKAANSELVFVYKVAGCRETTTLRPSQDSSAVKSIDLAVEEWRQELLQSTSLTTAVLKRARSAKQETSVQLFLLRFGLPAVEEAARPPLLFSFCMHGLMTPVKVLLEAKVDPNKAIEWSTGATPLNFACQQGYVDCVDLLLQYDADMEQTNQMNGGFPLLLAAGNGHEDCVDLLLEKGANINKNDPIVGNFPLFTACERGMPGCVEKLLERRADMNMTMPFSFGKPASGNSPLAIASNEGHVACVVKMLEKRAQVNIENPYNGKFPLLHACARGHADCAEKLLEARADINREAREPDLGFPLWVASLFGHSACIALLLAVRADVTQESQYDGTTALRIAKMEGRTNVFGLLLEARADPTDLDRGMPVLSTVIAPGIVIGEGEELSMEQLVHRLFQVDASSR